ncbi:MAG: hypothetical protein CMK32_10210 [Porticoccaceae bacterium]|nr:hypothetical protein [Porticoccaceae bacterium]
MSEAPELKVGDKIAFRAGYGTGQWQIVPVERITPKGFIKCGTYTLNPDLLIRGRRNAWGPYRGEIATPEIIHEAKVQQARSEISIVNTSKLSDEAAMKIYNIIKEEHAKSERTEE